MRNWHNHLKPAIELSRSRRSGLVLLVVGLVALAYAALWLYHSFKPLPAGLNYQSSAYTVNSDDLDFLRDLTFVNNQNRWQSEQEIFDTVFKYLEQAEQYILVDMFLFNDFTGQEATIHRKLSAELVERLLAKKNNQPDIMIDVIVDPINTVYGGFENRQLDLLAAAGVNVIVTDLRPLRDDNPLYSAAWRLFFSVFGNSTHGWLPHPFDKSGKKVSLRSYLAMLNFKANHRKVFVMDNQGELVSIIGSANAHDASSAHANTALVIKGVFGQEVYKSEAAVAVLSANSLQPLPQNLLAEKSGANDYAAVSLLTEGRIKQEALAIINGLSDRDRLWLAMFYLSDRQIITALKAAAGRGAEISIILDPSKDAFGYLKNGIPNRQVAAELLKKTAGQIQVRWYKTSGEQFHSKMLLTVNQREQSAQLLIGSANLTKRNIGNFNLETDVKVAGRSDLPLFVEVLDYFQALWTNADGHSYTDNYETYQDNFWWRTIFYRLQEATGVSSF